MESIAFIWGRYMVYWSTAIVTMACGVGMLLFLFLYLWDEEDYLGGFWALPLGLGLGMLGARLAHWYFRRDAYESLAAALTDYSVGGFLLAGAFAGVFLAALILAALRRGRHLGAMLDAMSMAGAGAIALGRLSCLTNSSDRGAILPEGSFWGGKVLSVSTGAVEFLGESPGKASAPALPGTKTGERSPGCSVSFSAAARAFSGSGLGADFMAPAKAL